MIAQKVDNGITVWSGRLALVLLGWFASSAYYGTLTLTQKAATLQHVQAVDIPKLKAQAHCEDARANKATDVAGKAILGATIASVPVPQFKDLPVDNCPRPAGK